MVNENEIMFKGNPNIVYPKAPGRGLSFKCYKCPSIFDRKEALITHSSLHGSNKKFKCHLCDYAVNSAELLAKHMSKHSDSNIEVGTTETQSEDMEQPLESSDLIVEDSAVPRKRKVNSKRTYVKCSKCPARLSSRTNLRRHMTNHSNTSPQPFQCQKCSFGTRRQDAFRRHLAVHESRKPDTFVKERRRRGRIVARKYTCHQCPQVFRGFRDLERHLKKHNTQYGRFQCSQCNFSAKRREVLQIHTMSHTNDETKPVTSLKTTSEDHETSMDWESQPHQKSETSIQTDESTPGSRNYPYPCPKCPFAAKSQQDIASHMNCHNENRGPYKCSSCDYNTNKPFLFLRHEQLHRKVTSTPLVKEFSRRRAKDGSTWKFSISKEDYDRFRKGNPAIKYEPYIRYGNKGELREIACFKCLKCPFQIAEYTRYAEHGAYHDGTPRRFQCNICSYSHNVKIRMEKHVSLHTNGSFAESSTIGSKIKNEQSVANTKSPVKSVPNAPSKPVVVQRVMPQTQGSRDAMDWTPSSAELKCFNELYSSNPSDNEQANWTKFLVQRMKIENFMSIKSVDLATTNILTFQGIGKSASVTALLLGLGYDFLLPDHNPEQLCGINVRDFIQRGFEESTVELTLSLHAAPKLQREYGSHLRLIRTLQRGVPPALNTFKVVSADTKERFPKNVEVIGRKRMQRIQKHVGIKPQFYRLLLLDEVNLENILKATSSWYGFYRLTYDSRKSKFECRLRLLRLKFKRLQGEIEWRNQKCEFLEDEIEKSVTENRPTEKDEKELDDLKIELGHMQEKENELTTGINSYLNELNKLTNVLTGRLKFRYQEFLHRQNYTGSILVDDKEEALRIWICRDKQTAPLRSIEEADELWSSTAKDLQRLAVIGLFFALIDIAESSIFFMDAWSNRSTEFSIPSTAFPLLFELIEKKCSQGHQFVTSLPDDDNDVLPTVDSV